MNVFTTLFSNPLFFVVFIFEMGIQTWMIQLGNSELGSILVGTAPLTFNQILVCWILGAFSLVVHVLLKFIPMEKLSFVEKLDIEVNPDDNPIMAKFAEGRNSVRR